jgi:hypothetical protein
VESDVDVWSLLTLLYYRAASVAINDDCCRVRAFLLPAGDGDAPSTVACMRQNASSSALLHEISELNMGSMSTTTTSRSDLLIHVPMKTTGESRRYGGRRAQDQL